MTTFKEIKKVVLGEVIMMATILLWVLINEDIYIDIDDGLMMGAWFVASVVVTYVGYHLIKGIKRDVAEIRNRNRRVIERHSEVKIGA